MPPIDDYISAPPQTRITVQLEPVFNAIHSLVMLTRADKLSGLGEWVYDTVAKMTPKEREQNMLVMWGLHYAVAPQQSWASFPAYIKHLDQMDPVELRDKLMYAYASIPVRPTDDASEEWCEIVEVDPATVDIEAALVSVDAYLDFLRARFSEESVFEDIESLAYSYAANPPAMQELIVNHLQAMWDKYLKAEWERVLPMLEDSARAFQQIDFSGMSDMEVARFVTGQDLEDHWEQTFQRSERIIFTPCAHVGPYLGKFHLGEAYGVIFGARLPEGTEVDAPDLSRAEIAVRLNALADDTRLRILKYIADHGEQSSKEIMDTLDLSQSATSRHLRQLNATGYLTARRVESAKYFDINSERIESTLQAISAFLLSS